jgi:hypothetical protein
VPSKRIGVLARPQGRAEKKHLSGRGESDAPPRQKLPMMRFLAGVRVRFADLST